MKKEPIAIKPITNLWSTVIYDMDQLLDDRVLVGDVFGDKRYPARWCEVRYDDPAGPYFLHFRKKEYLAEYMKAEYVLAEQKAGEMIDHGTF